MDLYEIILDAAKEDARSPLTESEEQNRRYRYLLRPAILDCLQPWIWMADELAEIGSLYVSCHGLQTSDATQLANKPVIHHAPGT
jgi:hypothetical protein